MPGCLSWSKNFWNLQVLRDKAQALATSLAIRTALVASTVAVALSVPQFAYVTALGGSLFGLTVCVCIPAVAFLKIN